MFRKHKHEKHDEGKKHRFRGIKILFWLGVVAGLAALWAPSIIINHQTKPIRYNGANVPTVTLPKRDTAIVFGAALKNDGKDLSPFLMIRVKAAVALYQTGRVEQILMTGDGAHADHDEPAVMRREAIRLGVPAGSIMMDKFGFDTYDSCYRARQVRDVTSAIVVTQGYHLPRAVYSCQQNGIDTIGLDAPTIISRRNMAWYTLREWLSTDKLFLQLGARAAKDRLPQ
jgi:vancomycin permeability regulator SanA